MTQHAASIQSMTGYGRVEGRAPDMGVDWVWDLRSVNGKGLDVRCRLPSGYDVLEKPMRDRMAAVFSRGNVNVSLTVNRLASAPTLQINEEWLADLIASAAKWQERAASTISPPTFDGLLQVKGVVEAAEAPQSTPEQDEALHGLMLADLDLAIANLRTAREDEGARMAAVVHEQVASIATLLGQAETCATLRDDALKTRLHRQVSDLLEAKADLPQDRILQELVVLATRYDVREELDRLKCHIEAAQDLLALGRGIGRKFDFLCQEFNRESNTLCSKSADPKLTAVGLELKTVIDRLREQIQNIE